MLPGRTRRPHPAPLLLLVAVLFAALPWASLRAAEISEESGVQLHPVEGGDIAGLVRDAGGETVLVNIWATWCKPCREEMPALLRLQQEYENRGFRLILVSTDFERNREQAARALADWGVRGASYIKQQKDQAFIAAVHPDWSGALPASFLYDGSGELLEWWKGGRSYDALESAVLRHLPRQDKE